MDDTYKNIYDKQTLKEKLAEETFSRRTVSFYRYVIIDSPEELRDELYIKWNKLGILGRTYLAKEGINAQINVPEHNWKFFLEELYGDERFKDIPMKIAVEDDDESFLKLTIKVRNKIVADGLDDHAFDVTNVGNHLSAKEWNQAMENENTIVVDMRNHYESEVGHFQGAVCPDVDTFKEELPYVAEKLKDDKDKKVLLYCTGGIRCEKASAYLKSEGFEDVNQLHGGIIDYAKQVTQEGLDMKYIGKNFVFDERLGEKISTDIISECHQCGNPSDDHTNCKNDECHLLFIQCIDCKEKMDNCCTPKCKEIANLPIEEQRKLRRGKKKEGDQNSVYKSRLRPNLKEILKKEVVTI